GIADVHDRLRDLRILRPDAAGVPVPGQAVLAFRLGETALPLLDRAEHEMGMRGRRVILTARTAADRPSTEARALAGAQIPEKDSDARELQQRRRDDSVAWTQHGFLKRQRSSHGGIRRREPARGDEGAT